MRRAKRTFAEKAGARAQQSGHRVHRRRIERLVERQWRQNPRDAPRHHRLARTRWSDQEQIVSAGRGNFERAPREQLAAYIAQVGQVASVGQVARAGYGRGGR